MLLLQPIAIDLSEGKPYAVYFPSLPGCNAIGNSIEEALQNAMEAATAHLEILIEDGDELPHSANINELMLLSEYKQCVWALLELKIPYTNISSI
ncbi:MULTISPECIES: type II toxin-antitoxin system HicB family antitoxin [unclassified Acinetobacter]|uniref:type II toxin-antitoxin system HicB family antitoxin n=1 Tax=unclassified Acinetobacter TaxID=196816 RepID=UPI0025C2C884|nr:MULTISPECIES: type II toxin-antitoxin system HicB family antitoxin [unclassified Acinetobacter]